MKIRISVLDNFVKSSFNQDEFKKAFIGYFEGLAPKDVTIGVRDANVYNISRVVDIDKTTMPEVTISFSVFHELTKQYKKIEIYLPNEDNIVDGKEAIIKRLADIKEILLDEIQKQVKAYDDSYSFNPFKELKRGA